MLKGIIESYQNDFQGGYENDDKEELNPIILELIMEVSRYVNEIRYCSKKDCGCSPERNIKRILEQHKRLEQVLFLPYGLSSVNMPLVYKTLQAL